MRPIPSRSIHFLKMKEATLKRALQSLPHGPGFRYVDALISLEPGKCGTGTYAVKGDEAFFTGHFPGNPIMPGVIMIEALAQLGGIIAQTDPLVPPLADLRLTAVRNAKINGSAVPGEILELAATVSGRMGGLIMIEGTVTCCGTVIVTAQVTLSGISS